MAPELTIPYHLEAVANNEALMGVAHKAIEDVLVEWRDLRLSTPFASNGLVIKERNGDDSHIIRMTPREAMHVGLMAIAKHLTKEAQ